MELVELDLADADQVEHYWRVRETALSAGRPRFPPTTLDDFRELMALPTPRYRRRVTGIRARSSLLGVAMELIPTDPGAEDVWVFPYVAPHYRGDGVGSLLMEELIGRASAMGRQRMLSTIEFSGDSLMEAGRHPYVHFARSHGFEIGRRVVRWELTLPVPGAVHESFDRAVLPRAEGYSLAACEGLVPARWRDGFLALRDLARAHAAETGAAAILPEQFPEDDEEAITTLWTEMGHRLVTILALHDTDVVGFARARVPAKPESAPTAHGDTYVAEPHRRHRIGPLLELALAAWLDVRTPERPHVQVSTVDVDRKLASLARAVGYVPIETLVRVTRRVTQEPVDGKASSR